MKKLGIREIDIAEISNQEEFMSRVDEPRIALRAASIVDVGLLHEPWVRASDMKLIVGRDRMAAQVKLGHKSVRVELVECSDEEASLVELEENFARRHDKDEQERLAIERTAKYAAYFETLPKVKGPKRPTGVRGKTAMGKAREKVAKELGITEHALRKREQKHREKKQDKEVEKVIEKGDTNAAPVADIKLLGMDVGDDFIKKVSAVRVYIDRARSHAIASKRTISYLRGAELPANPGLLQRLFDDLHNADVALKAARPFSLCPFCKGLAGIQESCGGCVTTGYITEGQQHGVPPELWTEGPMASVMWQGKQVLVSDLVDTQAGEAIAEVEQAEESLFGGMPE